MSRPARTPLFRGWLEAGLLVGGLALLVLVDRPLCPMAGLLGIPCPGCGLTRAGLALLRGDVSTALHLHPLSPVLIPLVVWAVAGTLWGQIRGTHFALGVVDRTGHPSSRFLAWRRLGQWLAWLLLAAVLLVWVARFLGAFGGPVPVSSWHSALAPHQQQPSTHRLDGS